MRKVEVLAMKWILHTQFPEYLKDAWNTLLEEAITNVPFLRYEYLAAWWETRGGGEWPRAQLALVTAHEQERLIGVAPLFFVPEPQGRPTLLFLGSVEISDYLDFIVRPADLERFVDGLWVFLTQELPFEWQALDLYNLIETSPTLSVLNTWSPQHHLTLQVERLQPSPYIPLPGDWEAYLASLDKKQRHEIRRKLRRAEGHTSMVCWYCAGENVEAEVEAFLDLMAQDEDKAAFLTPVMRQTLRRIALAAAAHGYLQLAFLEIGKEKAAAYFNFDYHGRVYVYNTGFNRRFNDLSPGWVLLSYLLQWANQNGRKEFDFMRGDEAYKYRFGAINRYVVRVTLLRQPASASALGAASTSVQE
ncbi:hypothetical protein SE15_01605 [Thermanaerothrix daxensis]|uniref:BioF2-like acetyltransferase domain-containing protein n=2 Tax=Thermanaerothrix daxensis TaxID=869279 RepID=A0A0P6YMH0_9CHLR|nr:hypothetical protein SE15_01605 [Thermanaerothrix daxensis]